MFSKPHQESPQEIQPEIFHSECWYVLRKRSGYYELYHGYGYEREDDEPWVGSGPVSYSHLTWSQVKYLNEICPGGPKWSYLDEEQEERLLELGKMGS